MNENKGTWVLCQTQIDPSLSHTFPFTKVPSVSNEPQVSNQQSYLIWRKNQQPAELNDISNEYY